LSVESFRPVYLLVFYSSAAICMASAWGWSAFGFGVLDSPSIRDAGSLLALTGSGLAWWAKRSLGASYSPCYASVVPPRLIALGPYRWVRHPLYSANLLTLVGLFFATGSRVLLAAIAAVGCFYLDAARREERTLSAELSEYRAYLAVTGRFAPRFIDCRLRRRTD
jgi:protein-S-isoprenylcysteine O-methyltransferase Ste14